MKFAGAPPGIKFALGENVKQSNLEGPTPTRYPQSRMGVEQIIRDALCTGPRLFGRSGSAGTHRTRACRRGAIWSSTPWPKSLQKKRWVHCHSYRQDEILALIRDLRRLRHHDRLAAAYSRRLQGRRRDGQARRNRLVVFRLVGLQDRGHRRDSVQRRADAPRRKSSSRSTPTTRNWAGT